MPAMARFFRSSTPDGTGQRSRRGSREPVLIPGPDTPRPTRPSPPPPTVRDRNGLAPALVERTAGYKPLRGARTPVRPRDIFADPELGPVLTGSFATHAALLALALFLATRHPPMGNPSGEAAPVEMMFVTPPATSGMRGQNSPEAGGGNEAASNSKSSAGAPQEADSAPAQSAAATETPAAPPLVEAPSTEHVPPQPQQKATVSPTEKTAGQARPSPSHRKSAAKPVPRQRRQEQRAASPFDSLTDLSFDQSSAPRRSRSGRSGGSGGPIDLSVGPLVSNGKLNAPYSTRATTRGVSRDYASEVDAWIRRHMFYPPDAAHDGEEGGSSVHVVIDRGGHVRFVRLTDQSGSYRLDAATTGMFQNSQLPPVPPDIPGDHFDLDVTINYILIRR
ncbi:energy transducer TonB [Acetobacter sp. AN02]|uniref:energy transducer TonB n=1 Tax=Acetobacter sp. AN02 TaxID=2894186 RepID=UPI0024342305|nr:energy transducer TonB [Acetobacter sp. AN02]MDG6095006.1 energy transducer TonB [Acetobacter sp. AN02]